MNWNIFVLIDDLLYLLTINSNRAARMCFIFNVEISSVKLSKSNFDYIIKNRIDAQISIRFLEAFSHAEFVTETLVYNRFDPPTWKFHFKHFFEPPDDKFLKNKLLSYVVPVLCFRMQKLVNWKANNRTNDSCLRTKYLLLVEKFLLDVICGMFTWSIDFYM